MKNLLDYLIRSIVSKADEVKILESSENGVLNLNVSVSQEDYGTILGKKGRTIKALRDLLRLKAQRENIHYNLVIDNLPEPDSNENQHLDRLSPGL